MTTCIHIDDDGRRAFAQCLQCGNYIKIWSNPLTRGGEVNAFVEEHWDCIREQFVSLGDTEEGELPTLCGVTILDTEEGEPYFADDEDRCPRMGMQGAALRPRRIGC